MVRIRAWGGACLISHTGCLGQNGLMRGIVRASAAVSPTRWPHTLTAWKAIHLCPLFVMVGPASHETPRESWMRRHKLSGMLKWSAPPHTKGQPPAFREEQEVNSSQAVFVMGEPGSAFLDFASEKELVGGPWSRVGWEQKDSYEKGRTFCHPRGGCWAYICLSFYPGGKGFGPTYSFYLPSELATSLCLNHPRSRLWTCPITAVRDTKRMQIPLGTSLYVYVHFCLPLSPPVLWITWSPYNHLQMDDKKRADK